MVCYAISAIVSMHKLVSAMTANLSAATVFFLDHHAKVALDQSVAA